MPTALLDSRKSTSLRRGKGIFYEHLTMANPGYQFPISTPKEGITELHVHLGGAVPIHRLFEAAVDRGIHLPVTTYDEFERLLHRRRDNSGSLERYLEVYHVAERIQSGPRAVRESVLVALNGAARTGGATRVDTEGEAITPAAYRLPIRAIELRLNPMKRNGGGIWDLDRVMMAACSAVEERRTAYKGRLHAGLLVCLGRDLPWEQNAILADKVALWSSKGLPIYGIDLAGPESSLPLRDIEEIKRMADLFERAGDKVGRTIHCGETEHTTLDSFLSVMRNLKPNRVGHPLVVARAFWSDGDDRGLRYLAEHDIVAELCVVSNLLTGAVKDVHEYGRLLKTFDEYGVKYTFSTDAPALQKTTLAGELYLLYSKGAASPEQIQRSFETARNYTFLPDP